MLHTAPIEDVIDSFMPHGMCYLWRPDLILLHVTSDAVIALSYYSIPVALAFLVRRRRDLEFSWLFLMFAGFILACGTTHLMAIWTLWQPDYWLDGGIKLVTAAVSLITAFMAWHIMPRALAIPSRSQLANANEALAVEIRERERAEHAVRELNRDLEGRVLSRTAELEVANAQLRQALREKEVLLHEVHHRVKNNLMIIQSLLTMQARSGPPELKASLDEAILRIRALARVHDQLNLAHDASSFELKAYLERLCQDLTQAFAGQRDIKCAVGGEPVRIPLQSATPIVLIANEILSNAFKHAFADGRAGSIQVDLRTTADQIVLAIGDDGAGLPDAAAAGKPGSIGLRLVQLLCTQLQAQLSTTPRPRGSEFRVTMPRPALAAAA